MELADSHAISYSGWLKLVGPKLVVSDDDEVHRRHMDIVLVNSAWRANGTGR